MFSRFHPLNLEAMEEMLPFPLSPGVIDEKLQRALRLKEWLDVQRWFEWCSNCNLRKRVIEEACAYRAATEEGRYSFTISSIARCCSQDEADEMCSELVRRGIWGEFSCDRGVLSKCSERKRRWAIRRASQHADRSHLMGILRNCPQEQNLKEFVCRQLIKRGMWYVIRGHNLDQSETSRRMFIEEAAKRAGDIEFELVVLNSRSLYPDQLSSVLETLVNRGLWRSVLSLLRNDKTISSDKIQWCVRTGVLSNVSLDLRELLKFCLPDQVQPLLKEAVDKGLCGTVGFLLDRLGESSEQTTWAVKTALERCAPNQNLYQLVRHCDARQLQVLMFKAVSFGHMFTVKTLIEENFQLKPLPEFMSLWADSFVFLLKTGCHLHSYTSPASQENEAVGISFTQNEFLNHMLSRAKLDDEYQEDAVNGFVCRLEVALQHSCSTKNMEFQYKDMLQKYFKLYFVNRGERDSFQRLNALVCWVILPMFAIQNVNSCLQNHALSLLCKSSKWEAILDAPMSFVWGEVRRTLFQAAVEQRQWSAVTKLGDHNLYDDQRGWALGEALRERQMNVMVVLGEHGLTNYQLRRVHRQVAKHGEWKLFLRLRDQGANVKEVRQDLETANIGRERPPSEEAIKKYNKRLQQLRELERQIFRDSKHFEVAVANRNWPAVLLRLRRKGTEDMINTALRAAVEAQAWYVVVLLVKLGLSAEQRNLLFPEAIKHQLWGLGRALLEREHGVSAHLCESFLPQLIEARQWVLVARVVEQDVDDVVRRRILQQAIDKREGSVAAHCISIIRDRMSVDERESIFKRVLAEDQWLVVRPLVEEQDSTGADQRVRAFLAAIERERWDDVDHCVHHGADIDMKDEDGHTLLQKYAREKCWSKVEGLVRLGASQSMVDKDGYLAIHRAANEREVCFKQPEALKALVEFHGDINQRDPEGYTPLHRFIQYNYTAMVECALLWGRNVGQRIAYDGKTVLHLMSENNLPDTIRFIVGRGGDPLALDSRGQTILSYACKPGYRKGRRALVECIKLGITTYQPYINLLIRLGYISTGAFSRMLSYHIAPFETAYEQKDVVAMGMLYESGACSYLEMFDLYAQPQFVMEFGKPDDFDNLSMIDQVCWREEDLLQKRKNRVSMQYLARIATNPRSLQSMCRILISLFVDVGKFKWRKEKVKRLPVLSDKMKDYVLFCDLIRPDFGKQWMCD